MKTETSNQNIEIRLLIEAIYQKYGYDFRSYSMASIKRRILRRLSLSGLESISALQHKIIYDESFFSTLLLDLSINVTEMFRDPSFYLALRQTIVPELKKYPFLKIWHAGCATGEEVYSVAIVLQEEGLFERTHIYATDFNEVVIQKARQGIYEIDKLKTYTRNYQNAGGCASFGDYYTARYEYARMKQFLKENITFSDHNLVTDGTFGEMNMILCRNVLIYFNRELQNRVFGLLKESLCEGGYLCIGTKESIRFSSVSDDFEDVVKKERIYRKKAKNEKDTG
jgi:chemotaxis protein methyltransferase CheR